jgi:hypothetical protein
MAEQEDDTLFIDDDDDKQLTMHASRLPPWKIALWMTMKMSTVPPASRCSKPPS